MVAATQQKNGHRTDLVPSAMIAELNGRKVMPRARMSNGMMPADIKTVDVTVLPATKTRKEDQGPSDRVAMALSEEGDPAHMLAELRDVLFGPTRKLQEARLEELVGILEQLDNEFQQTGRRVAEQFANADAVDQKLASDIHLTNKVIEDLKEQHARELADANAKINNLSERLRNEMRHATEKLEGDLASQADIFTAKLDGLDAKLTHHIAEVCEHHKLVVEAMAADFSNQIRDLSASSKSSDEKIRMELDSRVALLAANAEDDKRRSIKVLTEGLSGLSERLHTL